LAQNVYEGLFIFDSNRFGHDPNGVSTQVTSLIEKQGGEILVSRLWEDRRLAYPIKGQRKGTYWLMYFRLSTDQLAEIKKQFLINDNILRSLLLRVDPRIVDTLVEHARSAPVIVTPHVEEAPEIEKVVLAGVELDAEELNVDLDTEDEE